MPEINYLDNNEYLKLITSEYAEQPNFNAYVSAFLNSIQSASECIASFDQIFNLENAVGDQLDQLGQLVGLTRELPIVDPDIPAVLDDEYFRIVIQARIRANFWDGTIGQLNELISATFPDAAFNIIDGQDMTMQITMINPTASMQLIALMFNGYIIPKPSGVKTNFTVIDKPLFGWDSDTSFVKGWDLASWNDQ